MKCPKCEEEMILENEEILPLRWCLNCGLKLPSKEYPSLSLKPTSYKGYWKIKNGELVKEV